MRKRASSSKEDTDVDTPSRRGLTSLAASSSSGGSSSKPRKKSTSLGETGWSAVDQILAARAADREKKSSTSTSASTPAASSASSQDRARERERERDRFRDREKTSSKAKEKEREKEKRVMREKQKEKDKEKEKEKEREKEKRAVAKMEKDRKEKRPSSVSSINRESRHRSSSPSLSRTTGDIGYYYYTSYSSSISTSSPSSNSNPNPTSTSTTTTTTTSSSFPNSSQHLGSSSSSSSSFSTSPASSPGQASSLANSRASPFPLPNYAEHRSEKEKEKERKKKKKGKKTKSPLGTGVSSPDESERENSLNDEENAEYGNGIDGNNNSNNKDNDNDSDDLEVTRFRACSQGDSSCEETYEEPVRTRELRRRDFHNHHDKNGRDLAATLATSPTDQSSSAAKRLAMLRKKLRRTKSNPDLDDEGGIEISMDGDGKKGKRRKEKRKERKEKKEKQRQEKREKKEKRNSGSKESSKESSGKQSPEEGLSGRELSPRAYGKKAGQRLLAESGRTLKIGSSGGNGEKGTNWEWSDNGEGYEEDDGWIVSSKICGDGSKATKIGKLQDSDETVNEEGGWIIPQQQQKPQQTWLASPRSAVGGSASGPLRASGTLIGRRTEVAKEPPANVPTEEKCPTPPASSLAPPKVDSGNLSAPVPVIPELEKQPSTGKVPPLLGVAFTGSTGLSLDSMAKSLDKTASPQTPVDANDGRPRTPQQVAEWMTDVGLKQYAPTFIQAGIDGQRLLKLQRDDLVELGIDPFGRTRILQVIAFLNFGGAKDFNSPERTEN